MLTLDRKTYRAIEKECRREARDMVRIQYELYDAIWSNRIRITPALYDHGKETIYSIMDSMPNLFVHDPIHSPVDIVSEQFGFADTSDLIEYLLAYKPRGPVEDRFYEKFFEERLSYFMQAEQAGGVDDVPF